MKKIEKKDITLLISFKKKLSLYPGYAVIILFFSLLFSSTGIGLAGIVLNPVEENFKDKPLIFPIPSEVQINKGIFSVDKSVFIMVPDKESKSNDFFVKLLFNEFVDRYEQSINIAIRSSYTEKDRFILIGDITNPLVKDYCEKKGLLNSLKELGPEGYILSVSANNVVIASNSKKGTLFGFESLRQIISKEDGNLFIPQLIVKDAPQFPFRGIKVYLPGRENITFFKRFIKDFVALYKFNNIILELNANMRLDRHPELNIGAVEFYRHLNFSRLDRPPGMHQEFQNSSHQDNADGGILEKEEVADLVSYMRKFNLEVIPELPSLTHSYYLLAGHKDLAENPEQPYPDTYCPLKPESYKIYFDVLDEYIDVIHPSIIHIGHDEWRMEKNKCALCRGKDYGQLYADDVTKIHDYLAKKGIKTALWGDHLLESVTHKDHQEWESSTGYKYNIPGALTPEQVMKSIPKDILVFNWFWGDINNDKQVSDFGFKQVYGNFTPDIEKWNERTKIKGLSGGVPSSWAGTTEKNFGKDQIYDFLGTANLLWSEHYVPENKLAVITNALIGEIRINFRGKILPGESGVNVSALDISYHFNSSLTTGIDSLNNSDLLTGSLKAGNKTFNISSPSDQGKRAIVVVSQKGGLKTTSVQNIKINKDVNSIIFLHACAKPGSNEKAYSMIYNFDETAELLGWYEIVYDDGFVETIPIRYGINILDWKWQQRTMNNIKDKDSSSQKYAYDATALICSKENSDPVTFFSFEWENPRYGKKITGINLRSINNKLNNENAVILLAISISEKNEAVAAQGIEKE
jgi:Glycosyl hydrolase family 20, catalytic domain/Glycosyl hydrolase family 20, domain 2